MKSILFKSNMVKAIAEGRKTQTRRLDGLKEISQETDRWSQGKIIERGCFVFNLENTLRLKFVKPRYQVGDVVYITEAWADLWQSKRDIGDIAYKLDLPADVAVAKWRSPRFMPKRAARYFIKITDVRCERLQEITEEDAIDEGAIVMHSEDIDEESGYSFRLGFMDLWDSVNPKYPWASNPWVWRFEFEKAEK